jgi:hypothetical protein
VRLATEAQADRCVGTRLLFELFIAKEAELRFEALEACKVEGKHGRS